MVWFKIRRLFSVLLCSTLFFASFNLSGQNKIINQQQVKSISEKTGISITKIEQTTTIFNRYTVLIANLKNKEGTPLKERRKQINTLKQAMKVELETVLSSEELLEFQKTLAIEKQKEASILSDDVRKTMFTEIRTYLKKAYFPLVKEERLALEKQLDLTALHKIESHKNEMTKLQLTFREKQKSCKTLNMREQRKCMKTVRDLKKEVQSNNKACKDWLQSNETFENVFSNIKDKKQTWQTEVYKILSKYYVNMDTAEFPVKPNHFLKHTAPLSFAFLDAEKLAWQDEDFSTYGKIDFAHHENGRSWVSYQLEKAAHATIQVLSHNITMDQNINEAKLEAGIYKTELSTSLESGLYIVRLILNGKLADAKKIIIP